MSEYSFSTGESRVVLLLDETCIVLASDRDKRIASPLTRRQKAIAVALLETAIAEINDEIEVVK